MNYTKIILICIFFVNTAIAQDRALGHAASNGKVEKVERLIAKGADVNSKAYGGWTPLVVALKYRKTNVARSLIKNGADVNLICDQKWIPLTIATRHNQSDIVKLLIENGANINKVDGFGHTAMYYAGRNKNPAIISLLEKSRKIEIDFSLFSTVELKEMYKEAIFKKDNENMELIKNALLKRKQQ